MSSDGIVVTNRYELDTNTRIQEMLRQHSAETLHRAEEREKILMSKTSLLEWICMKLFVHQK